MSLLLSNLRSLTILLLVELAFLQIQVEGFTIGKADTVLESHNSEPIDTRSVKDWDGNTKPPGHGKFDELEYNEIPIKENSSKSVQGIPGSTTQKSTTTAATNSTTINSSSINDGVIFANASRDVNGSSTATVPVATTANVREEQSDIKPENASTNFLTQKALINEPESTTANFNRPEKILLSNEKTNSESFRTENFDNVTESTTQLLLSSNTIADSENVTTSPPVQNTSYITLNPEKRYSSVIKLNNESDSVTTLENMSIVNTQLQNEYISTVKHDKSRHQNRFISYTEQENVTENSSLPQTESVSSVKPASNVSSINNRIQNESPSDNIGVVKPEIVTTNNNYVQSESTDTVNHENVTALNSVFQNVSVTALKAELMGTAMTPLEDVAVIAMQTEKMIDHDNVSVVPEDEFSTANQYQSTTVTIAQDQTEAPIVMLTEYVDNTNSNNYKLHHEINTENVLPMMSYSPKSVEISDINTTEMLPSTENGNNNQNVSSSTSTEAIMPSKEATITKELNHSNKGNKSNQYPSQNELTSNNDKENQARKGMNTSTPHWKKYIEIERKRMNTVKNNTKSESGEILVGASTAQGRSGLSLEKALSGASDINSLQQLKKDLLASNQTTTTERITDNYSTLVMNANLSEITKVAADSPRSQVGQNRTVSSLRAGYLDNSARSNTSPMPSLRDERNKHPDVSSTTTMTSSEYTVTSDRLPVTFTSRIQTTSTTKEMDSLPDQVSTSSQAPNLATYNIEEELLQAEILSNSRELEQQKKKRLNTFTENPTRRYDTSTEDELAVQPISNERPRGAGRYTVSPNYKPLKKIEVQPPKPFVRNPDDNSWRNESLSSLGIVFKANNSSKPLTQVLKNKTETVLNTLVENYNKEEQPELKQRLEKIAEKRKSKKKKINQFGETVYTDYEENSGEGPKSSEVSTRSSVMTSTTATPQNTRKVINESPLKTVTRKTKVKFDFNQKPGASIDDYDNDDDEVDYSLPDIDLKKSNVGGGSGVTQQTTPDAKQLLHEEFTYTPPPRSAFPERKPTVQYFPPREKTTTDTTVAVNDYDTDFQKLVDEYTLNLPDKQGVTEPSATAPTFRLPDSPRQVSPKLPETTAQPFSTSAPEPAHVYTVPNHDGHYERNSYVIKNFRDFLDEVLNSDEGLASRVTDEPLLTEKRPHFAPRGGPPKEFYDYQDQFRKDIMSRFAEDFDPNSHRFRANFPVVYNTSVVHSGVGGQAAESMAFVKRLYENAKGIQLTPCQEPCDRTVELSPAYELHYYLPEQEETEDKVASDIYQVRL